MSKVVIVKTSRASDEQSLSGVCIVNGSMVVVFDTKVVTDGLLPMPGATETPFPILQEEGASLPFDVKNVCLVVTKDASSADGSGMAYMTKSALSQDGSAQSDEDKHACVYAYAQAMLDVGISRVGQCIDGKIVADTELTLSRSGDAIDMITDADGEHIKRVIAEHAMERVYI